MIIQIVLFTKNNKIIVLFLMSLMISVVLSNNLSKTFAFSQSDDQLLTYNNEDIGIEIKYPQDWKPLERGKSPLVKSPTVVVYNPQSLDQRLDNSIRVPAFFTVNIESTNATPSEYYESLANRILSEPATKLYPSHGPIQLTLSGKSGLGMKGKFNNYIVSENFIIDEGKAYRLTFYSEPIYLHQYEHLIEKMLNSFKITK